MSQDSRRNATVNTAAGTKVHHAKFEDIKQFTPEKVNHLKRGGIRSGSGRTDFDSQQMLDKIPPSQRFGKDNQSSALNAKEYLLDKDASHIKPHSQGGSTDVDNILWENKSINRSRGAKEMTPKEQQNIAKQARIDNINGAWKAGLKAAPRGAMIGAITTAPFSMLRNGLRVARGEISTQEAIVESLKETTVGAGIGAVTAFGVTTVVAACPPVAIALTTMSPALLAAGGAGMIYEFFKLLNDHKKETKEYYESLTLEDLDYLKKLEADLEYEHQKSLLCIEESRAFHHTLSERPVQPGIATALQRYQKSAALAQAYGGKPIGEKALLPNQQNSLPGSSEGV